MDRRPKFFFNREKLEIDKYKSQEMSRRPRLKFELERRRDTYNRDISYPVISESELSSREIRKK